MAVTPRSSDAGFSLVELLVAMAFMAVIFTGIIPFMVRSTINNMTSYQTTEVTNQARNTLERYFQADFNDPLVTLSTGTELVVDEYFSGKDEEWLPTPVKSGDRAVWTRRVTVRQFAIGAIDDGALTPDEALDASAPAPQVALKQVEVFVESGAGMQSGVGPRRNITLSLVKSR